jgi:hypothetical protein
MRGYEERKGEAKRKREGRREKRGEEKEKLGNETWRKRGEWA